MTYQQWLQLYQGLLTSGMTQQQALSLLGPPPPQAGGAGAGGGLLGGAGGTVGAGLGGGGSSNPLMGLLLALAGPQAISATQAPYNLQMQAARNGMNPAAINQGTNALTKNLSQNLINSVSRAVSPTIAERGLATSPGMSQQMTAEALAPYELQEQQLGQSAYFQGQQMPFGVGSGLAGEYPASLVDYAALLGMQGA